MALEYGLHHSKAISAAGFGVEDASGNQTDLFNADGTFVGGLNASTVLFTESNAGTYNGTVDLPAGAIVQDIIVHAVALWTAGTSATMVVGDYDADGDPVDADGFFDGVNLKATDLLAGESINFSHTGGQEGAYLDSPASGAHVEERYSATARSIVGTVTSVGNGTAGRTLMTVVYTVPTPSAAVKAT